MSLITCSWMDGDWCDVRCSRCGVWCFVEEVAIVADMSRRGVVPYCWSCDHENSDLIPSHFYYLDETFLLGLGEESYLAHWKTNELKIRQEDLSLTRISRTAWDDLRNGRVVWLVKQRPTGLVVRLVAGGR